MPARLAYTWANSLVCSCSRLSFNARYCSCGRIVTVRRVWRIDWVHSDRDGQAWQSVVENLILMTSFFRRSLAGVQLLLVCPFGHVACCFSQSTRKWSASKPGGSTGLPSVVFPGWTHQINLIVPLAFHQELCVDITSIYNVLGRQQLFALKPGMNGCCHGCIGYLAHPFEKKGLRLSSPASFSLSGGTEPSIQEGNRSHSPEITPV
jgi:hypothetical protein